MTTPTSTSVGASTPRWSWATATIATSAVATHFPRWRQRPSGTSPYRIPTIVTASAAICSDGSAHARQSVRNSTPNGRGRRSTGASTYWMITPCRIQAIRTTTSCRTRLRINRANSSPHSSTVMTAHDPSAATSSIAPRSPGARNPASHPTIASSTTVTATAASRSSPANTSTDSTTNTTAAVSQPTPVVRSGRGRGGGLPEGRRRRAERGIPPGPSLTACTPGPAGWSAGTPTTPPNRSRIRRRSTSMRRPSSRRVHRRQAPRPRQRDPPGRWCPPQQPCRWVASQARSDGRTHGQRRSRVHQHRNARRSPPRRHAHNSRWPDPGRRELGPGTKLQDVVAAATATACSCSAPPGAVVDANRHDTFLGAPFFGDHTARWKMSCTTLSNNSRRVPGP